MTKRAFLISMFGLIVQYYDHHLFGLMAPKIAKYFIPETDHVKQLLDTYFILAITYAAKPVGAFVIGRIGDLYGRSTTFSISLLGGSIGSLIISLIPGYQHIGLISALILLVARTCVVTFVSPGTDGVRLYIYEQIGKDKQCLGTGLGASSTLIGTFIATISAWFFTLDIMPAYSWRFAFLLGSIMGVSMIFVHKFYGVVVEDFTKDEPEYEVARDQSTFKIVWDNLKLFITCLLVAGAIGSTNQFYIIFFGTYNFDALHIVNQSEMQLYTAVGTALYLFSAVAAGLMADYFGRKNISHIAFIVLVPITIATMLSLNQWRMSPSLFFATMIALPFFIIPSLAFLKQSIPIVIRYRIFSLAHALGSICISAPTAFVSLLLYRKTNLPWLPLCYFFTTILIIVIGTTILRKKYNAEKY